MRESTGRPRAEAGAGRLFAMALAAGLAVGAVSVPPYLYLSGPAHMLGNSAALWLLVPFGVGAVARGPVRGTAAGAVALPATVLAFVAVAALLSPHVAVSAAVFWLAAALVGGPVFGLCGSLWRRGTALPAGIAAAVVGGAFVAEAVGFQPGPAAGRVAEAMFGVAMTIVLARGGRQRLVAICVLPLVCAAGVACWAVVMQLLARIPVIA